MPLLSLYHSPVAPAEPQSREQERAMGSARPKFVSAEQFEFGGHTQLAVNLYCNQFFQLFRSAAAPYRFRRQRLRPVSVFVLNSIVVAFVVSAAVRPRPALPCRPRLVSMPVFEPRTRWCEKEDPRHSERECADESSTGSKPSLKVTSCPSKPSFQVTRGNMPRRLLRPMFHD
jgi:hypothetical protein